MLVRRSEEAEDGGQVNASASDCSALLREEKASLAAGQRGLRLFLSVIW